MSGGIFLIQNDESLVTMTEQSYDSEDLLQELLAKYPDLLAGDQVDPDEPRRWLFVAREYGVPDAEGSPDRWAVDHLFLDQDGIPTLVEVKRSADTRIRREVIGQMLDYAANAVVYWPVEAIRTAFATTAKGRNTDVESVLADFLGNGANAEGFWQQVRTNLHAGKVRLIFVADAIPPELRRVVEFLNSQMDPAQVLALEVKQYVGQNLKSLVPRVFGQTAEAATRKGTGSNPPRHKWDEESFFNELKKIAPTGSQAYEAATRLCKFATEEAQIVWGSGAATGTFLARWMRPDDTYCPLFGVDTNGELGICYGNIKDKLPPIAYDRVIRRLKELEGFGNLQERIARGVRGFGLQPAAMYPINTVFPDPSAVAAFLEVVRACREDVSKAV